MLNRFTTEDSKNMLIYVCDRIVENEPNLTEIDEKIGDGDHGIGMKRGFSHLKTELNERNTFTNINELMKFCGIELLKTMGGASGVLFCTFFIGGLKSVKETDEVTTKFLYDFFKGSLESIKKRGKAEYGDKTMVDPLEHVVESFKISADKNYDVFEALRKAKEAALVGVELTKHMIPKFGRARNYGNRAIGIQDAGATSVYLIFKSMSDWAEINRENNL